MKRLSIIILITALYTCTNAIAQESSGGLSGRSPEIITVMVGQYKLAHEGIFSFYQRGGAIIFMNNENSNFQTTFLAFLGFNFEFDLRNKHHKEKHGFLLSIAPHVTPMFNGPGGKWYWNASLWLTWKIDPYFTSFHQIDVRFNLEEENNPRVFFFTYHELTITAGGGPIAPMVVIETLNQLSPQSGTKVEYLEFGVGGMFKLTKNFNVVGNMLFTPPSGEHKNWGILMRVVLRYFL